MLSWSGGKALRPNLGGLRAALMMLRPSQRVWPRTSRASRSSARMGVLKAWRLTLGTSGLHTRTVILRRADHAGEGLGRPRRSVSRLWWNGYQERGTENQASPQTQAKPERSVAHGQFLFVHLLSDSGAAGWAQCHTVPPQRPPASKADPRTPTSPHHQPLMSTPPQTPFKICVLSAHRDGADAAQLCGGPASRNV